MMSGDGYVVRVRPRLARLTSAQAVGLCEAAMRFGAGLIDVTNRANIQIRGVTEADWPALMAALEGFDLLDPDAETESRRNIVVAPDWVEGDDTHRLTLDLLARLHDLPALPPKMGFAIDAGPAPVLTAVSTDFRIERSADGRLMLRADGRDAGLPLDQGAEINCLIRLVEWFATSGGVKAGRMARHHVPLPDWAQGSATPAATGPCLRAGPHDLGPVHGLTFGQVRACDLLQAITTSDATALRVTPWRVLLLEGGANGPHEGLLSDHDSPLMRVDACPGAPFCPQASVETRQLAARLAPKVQGRLHVSGCAKGCARMAAAEAVVIGNAGRYDIAMNARAGDTPVLTGLTLGQTLDHFGAA